MRKEHCAFCELNVNDRCIAICHWNIGTESVDCIGRTGKTLDGDREVPVGGSYLHGKNPNKEEK